MKRSNLIYFCCDLLMILLTPVLAISVRVDSIYVSTYTALIVVYILISLPVKLGCFCKFKLYSKLWIYAGFFEALDICKSLACSYLILLAIYLAALISGGANACGIVIPRSFLFIDFMLTFGILMTTRFSLRISELFSAENCTAINSDRVLIIGAGETGFLLARSLKKLAPQQKLIGFIDDDPRKQDSIINGVKVLGTLDRLADVLEQFPVHCIYVAISQLESAKTRDLLRCANAYKVKVRVLADMFNMFDSKEMTNNKLRELKIEDLLPRDPVELDPRGVRAMLQGKVILVTGAGGSIGSEICRQIMNFSPGRLVLLGHGENSLFNISCELKRKFSSPPLSVVVADVRDYVRLRGVFEKLKPQVVFNAAAHKHVPMMEENVCEAVTNNVGGIVNLTRLCGEFGVERLVTISSDKAVNPTNVMGTTKRITELVVNSAARRLNRIMVAVRFGNVLGSRGSVIPYFSQQIEAGGPVTVTHEDVTRFFMTIPEATQLVLQASMMGRHNEIFVLDMGKPVKIIDLAKDMIGLAGFVPGVDIKIEITGLRPGEKMFEELFGGEENPIPSACPKIFMSKLNHCDVPEIDRQVESLLEAARAGDEAETRKYLKLLVPESSIG